MPLVQGAESWSKTQKQHFSQAPDNPWGRTWVHATVDPCTGAVQSRAAWCRAGTPCWCRRSSAWPWWILHLGQTRPGCLGVPGTSRGIAQHLQGIVMSCFYTTLKTLRGTLIHFQLDLLARAEGGGVESSCNLRCLLTQGSVSYIRMNLAQDVFILKA